MRLRNLRAEAPSGARRIAADLQWEDADRPPDQLYYEVDDSFPGTLAPRAEAFLVATVPLASWLGERRIVVEGLVCPRLLDGLATAMELFEMWWEPCRRVAIHAADGIEPPSPRDDPLTASFLSGGIDALALLKSNRDGYPADHPGRIRECVVVLGLNRFEFDGPRHRDARLSAFRRYRRCLQELTDAAGVRLVPVRTNVRALYPAFRAWHFVGFGAGLVSAALALSPRYTDVLLGSDCEGFELPATNHPLLPPLYSTAATGARQSQVGMPRLEKTRVVAGWEPGLRVLRTCMERELHPDGLPNCGRCEKCLRTMVALAAVGVLERSPTYPADRLTPAMIRRLEIRGYWERRHLSECATALRSLGRHEEAGHLSARLARYDRETARAGSLVGRTLRRVRRHLPGAGTPGS